MARWTALLSIALLALSPWSPGPGASAGSASLLEFELRSLDEPASRQLSRYAGRPVLLLFFEPECSWCMRQIRVVNQLLERCSYQFTPIAVGVNGRAEALKRDLRRIRPDFPAYEASPALLEAIGGVPATPFMLLGDQRGDFVQWLRGYVEADALQAELVAAGAAACDPRPGAGQAATELR